MLLQHETAALSEGVKYLLIQPYMPWLRQQELRVCPSNPSITSELNTPARTVPSQSRDTPWALHSVHLAHTSLKGKLRSLHIPISYLGIEFPRVCAGCRMSRMTSPGKQMNHLFRNEVTRYAIYNLWRSLWQRRVRNVLRYLNPKPLNPIP